MTLHTRLKIMQFLQFFLWGSWLFTFASYAFNVLHFSGSEVGAIFSTFGIASFITPSLFGIVADKWINKERLFAILHILGALTLYKMSFVSDGNEIFWLMLLNMAFYMPTIPFGYSICYELLSKNNFSIEQNFPKIRVSGTVGFILAMWVISLSKLELSPLQLQLGALAQLVLGLYSLSIPKCPPIKRERSQSLIESFGLDALCLFKDKNIVIFLIFSMFLGMASQTSNIWTGVFLHSFDDIAKYKDVFAVKYPGIIVSIATISETGFILVIPFFLRRYGIKVIMLISMLSWSLRFGLLAFGNPGDGFVFILLSMFFYGCAFDFFNLSGSIYMNSVADARMRASAQGLFLTMVNGLGFILGGHLSGHLVDYYTTTTGTPSWPSIWLVCSLFLVIILVLFAWLFKYKHTKTQLDS